MTPSRYLFIDGVSIGGGSGIFYQGASLPLPLAIIGEQQVLGTEGGAFTSGAWRTRILNTEMVDLNDIVSIATNQFTIQAGTYILRGYAPAYNVSKHQLRFYNITDSSITAVGVSSYVSGTEGSEASIDCVVVIAGEKTFELQHQASVTGATVGLGVGCDMTTEQFAQVLIQKVA
jgi:hypothetical protein